MAVKEASRTRKVRLVYSADNPEPDSSSGTASGSILPSVAPHSTLGVEQKQYPAFAPSGATPVTESSILGVTRSLPSDFFYRYSGGESTIATSSSSRGVTGLFRKSFLPRGDWFTPGHRRRASDAIASGSPLVEEVGPASSFFTTKESNNEGDRVAKDVLLRSRKVGSEDVEEGGAGSYTARTDVTMFDVSHDQHGSVQQSQLSRVLKMPKWASPWRRVVGKDDSEDTALVDNQGSAEAGRAWAPKLSTWSSE